MRKLKRHRSGSGFDPVVTVTRRDRGLERFGEHHLHRYLAEFDFRHNARVALGVDEQRTAKMVRGAKRQAAHVPAAGEE